MALMAVEVDPKPPGGSVSQGGRSGGGFGPRWGSGEVVLHLRRRSLAVLDALLDGGGSVVVTGGCGGSHTTDRSQMRTTRSPVHRSVVLGFRWVDPLG
jgi:hypothetical protein